MTRPDARNQERAGKQVERIAEVLAEHANDGCGDCICSEYVLDVPFAAHVAEALVAAGIGVMPTCPTCGKADNEFCSGGFHVSVLPEAEVTEEHRKPATPVICTCPRGLPPLHGGYRPAEPCPKHPWYRDKPPQPPSGEGGGSRTRYAEHVTEWAEVER